MTRIGETEEARPVNLGELTRAVRMARLITDAALPLALDEDTNPQAARDALADRSHLRGIAFHTVLRELTRYECITSPSEIEALLDGRIPEPAYQPEARS